MNTESSFSKITIVAVDDSRTMMMMLTDIINSAGDMRMVGTASTGQDGMRRALELQPDVVLLDINLPDADGIQVAWNLSTKLPNSSIIMVTSEENTAIVQRAMLAGAQAYLTKPLSPETVVETIRNVRGRHLARVRILGTGQLLGGQPVDRGPERRGLRTVIFGAKGGIGKTTMAANLAVAVRTRTNKEVAVVDGDFSFGDLCLHLNVVSKVTIINMLSRMADLDSELLDRIMAVHPTGVRILAAPRRPEQSELVKVDHLNRLLTVLPRFYDYIFVDCPHSYDDRALAFLDHADLILLVLTPEIGAIRNAKEFMRLAGTLGYGRDKVRMVLNRADSGVGLTLAEIERALNVDQLLTVPSGGRSVTTSINEGNPLVLDSPKNPWAKAIQEIATLVEKRLAVGS